MCLPQTERKVRDIPVGAGTKTFHHVIVDETRERAPVVVGESEGASCHGNLNNTVDTGYSRRGKIVRRMST